MSYPYEIGPYEAFRDSICDSGSPDSVSICNDAYNKMMDLANAVAAYEAALAAIRVINGLDSDANIDDRLGHPDLQAEYAAIGAAKAAWREAHLTWVRCVSPHGELYSALENVQNNSDYDADDPGVYGRANNALYAIYEETQNEVRTWLTDRGFLFRRLIFDDGGQG